jgi:hypothetical protein
MQSALLWISFAALITLGTCASSDMYFHSIMWDDDTCDAEFGNCTSTNYEFNICYMLNSSDSGNMSDTESGMMGSVMYKQIKNTTSGKNSTMGIALKFTFMTDDCSGNRTKGLPVRPGCLLGLMGMVDSSSEMSNCTNVEAQEAKGGGSGSGSSGALLLAPSILVAAAALLFSIEI